MSHNVDFLWMPVILTQCTASQENLLLMVSATLGITSGYGCIITHFYLGGKAKNWCHSQSSAFPPHAKNVLWKRKKFK